MKGSLGQTHASNAVLEEFNVEVDNKADGVTGQLEIRQYLGPMDRRETVDQFDFNNDNGVYQKVQPDLTLEVSTFVGDPDGNLPLHSKTAEPQLATQCHFINRFQESWTKMPIHLDGGAHDPMRHPQSHRLRALRAFVVNHHRSLRLLRS